MWIKDGKEYTGGGVILDGVRHLAPTREQFTSAGYVWVEPPPASKRYSKLKIIRALGSAWEAKKIQLEAAGLYDQFVAAQFLAEDDPAFAAVYASLSAGEKAALEECLYDE